MALKLREKRGAEPLSKIEKFKLLSLMGGRRGGGRH